MSALVINHSLVATLRSSVSFYGNFPPNKLNKLMTQSYKVAGCDTDKGNATRL